MSVPERQAIGSDFNDFVQISSQIGNNKCRYDILIESNFQDGVQNE